MQPGKNVETGFQIQTPLFRQQKNLCALSANSHGPLKMATLSHKHLAA